MGIKPLEILYVLEINIVNKQCGNERRMDKYTTFSEVTSVVSGQMF